MTTILEHLLEVTIVVAAGLATVAALRRRSAALRHAILASSLLFVPLIPATGLVSPAWTIPAVDTWLADDAASSSTLRWLQEPIAVAPATSTPAPAAAAPGAAFAPAMLFAGVWLAGVAAGLLHLLVGMRRLSALAVASRPLDVPVWTAAAREVASALRITRPIDLRQNDNPTLLVTWGLWRPRVIVPATAVDWPADRIRSVLGHELAHVRRGDWAVQLAAEIVRIVYWFHPLAWVACRRLRDESEHACDDTVIDSGVAAQDYATHLFEVARAFAVHPRRWSPAAAIARPSTLERRIAAMLNADPNRRPARRWAPAAAIVMMGSVAVMSAGFDPTAGPAPTAADVELAASPVVVQPISSAAGALTAAPVAANAPIAAAPAAAAAQTGQALVFGRIYDQSDAVLPGVEVSLSPAGSAESRSAVTDGSGYYQFQGVSAGDYVVHTMLLGFSPTRAAVAVPATGSVEHSIKLELGTLQESITIIGERGTSAPPSQPRRVTAETRPRPPAPVNRVNRPAPVGAVRVGGAIKVPVKLVDVRPVYPTAAQAAGLEGVVILEAVIATDGSVKAVEVLRRTEPDMDSAAVEAVKGWRFTPTLLNGEPVDVRMTVTLNFALR